MAMQSQGIRLRRMSTDAGTTGYVASTNTLKVVSATKRIEWTSAGANFVTAGFSSGMRLVISGSTNNNRGVYTILAVATTYLALYDAVADQSVGDNLSITANRYDLIGEVKSWSGPSGNANVIDVTNLLSTAKEKLIGLRDEGQFTIECFFDPNYATAQHKALISDRANRTLQKFDVLFNETTSNSTSYPSGWNFDAYVSGFSVNAGVDAPVSASITLEITSAVKFIPRVGF